MESELDAGDMEMTSKEVAAYLSGAVGFEVSAKFLRNLRYVSRGQFQKTTHRMVRSRLHNRGKDVDLPIILTRFSNHLIPVYFQENR